MRWWVGRQLWDHPYSWAQRRQAGEPQPWGRENRPRSHTEGTRGSAGPPLPPHSPPGIPSHNSKDFPEGKGFLIEQGWPFTLLAPEEWGGQSPWGAVQGVCVCVGGVPVKIRWRESGGMGSLCGEWGTSYRG